MKRALKAAILAALSIAVALIACLSLFANSQASSVALKSMAFDPALIRKVGQIHSARQELFGNSIAVFSSVGKAELRFRIHGASGKASVLVRLEKSDGEWKFQSGSVFPDEGFPVPMHTTHSGWALLADVLNNLEKANHRKFVIKSFDPSALTFQALTPEGLERGYHHLLEAKLYGPSSDWYEELLEALHRSELLEAASYCDIRWGISNGSSDSSIYFNRNGSCACIARDCFRFRSEVVQQLELRFGDVFDHGWQDRLSVM